MRTYFLFLSLVSCSVDFINEVEPNDNKPQDVVIYNYPATILGNATKGDLDRYLTYSRNLDYTNHLYIYYTGLGDSGVIACMTTDNKYLLAFAKGDSGELVLPSDTLIYMGNLELEKHDYVLTFEVK